MPQTIARPRESTLNLRVDAALKMEFAAAVEAEEDAETSATSIPASRTAQSSGLEATPR